MTNYEKYNQFCQDNRMADETDFFQRLCELFGVSHSTAMDIWYAPQRSWFRPAMIDELIRLDKVGTEEFHPNLYSREFDWDSVNNRFLPENCTDTKK